MAALDRSAAGAQLFQRSSSMNKTEASETTPMAEEILVRQSSQERGSNASEAAWCVECPAEGKDAARWYRNAVLAFVGTLVVVGVVCVPSFGFGGMLEGEALPAAATEADRWEHASRALPFHLWVKSSLGSGKFLVNQGPSITYHKGYILTGDKKGTLRIHVLFYGAFTASQKSTITAFLSSFQNPKPSKRFPTVAGWWNIMKAYRNTKKYPVAPNVVLGTVVHDSKYSRQKNLKQSDIEALVVSNLKSGLALDPTGLYVVLTSADVAVQGFCSSQCGTHSVIGGSASTKKAKLPYVWVGDAAKMCGGYCAWPFFKPLPGTGPDVPPLKAPNGDGGIDGMIINIAGMVAGAASDPFGNGWYEGVAGDPLEAAGICAGQYGANSYPGYPGDLLKDSSGASFNTYGAQRRKFLVPWIFNPATKKCAGQA